MNNNDIGGFFATLGLLVDKNSFETGNKAVDAVTNKLSKLAGTVRNVAAIMGTYAVATGKIESAELKTASALGISAEKLNQWKTAAKLAGVNANSLVSSMSQMEMTFQKLKKGELDTNLAKQIGFLNIDWTKFEKMDAADRVKTVLDSARAMKDQGQAAELISSILGQSGLDFYEYLKLSNETVDSILKKSGALNFTNSADYQNAFAFDSQLNETKARIEAINKEFGSDIAESLTPVLESLNTWLAANGDELVEDLGKVAEAVGIIAKNLVPGAAAAADHVGQSVENAVVGAAQISEGDVAGGVKTMLVGETQGEEAQAYKDATGANSAVSNVVTVGRNLPIYGLAVHALDWAANKAGLTSDAEYNALWGKEGAVQQAKKKSKKMKDGIMRPDGTVTQVAPDDWVFAARNVSDLAAAFIPQGNTYSSPTEFVITQNFNINGSGGLMPQTIRQQAYAGTESAIQESIARTTQRLQFMPGAN